MQGNNNHYVFFVVIVAFLPMSFHAMSISFSDTVNSVYADLNHRSWVLVSLLVVLLCGWLLWLVFMPMTITKQANGYIEINQPLLTLVAATSGRVESVVIQTGDRVAEGQVLIQFNTEDEQQQIAALNTALLKQREVLDAQHKTQVSEQQTLAIEIAALDKKINNGAAQVDTVKSQYEQQTKLVAALGGATAAISKIEFQREQLLLQEIQERLLIRQQELASLKADAALLHEREGLLAARIAQANANHQALIAGVEAQLAEQLQRVKHKSLSVPVAAQVAEVMPLQKGQWIEAGQMLASLFPQGELRVVAQFKPTDAQGYLQSGQRANVQVDNFPWLQHGALAATVVQIEQAERQGSIRVLLALDAADAQRLPLAHGMSASIGVFTASVTPWQLLLQGLGQRQASR
jgi:multidrug resistance efflux pump